MINLIEQNLFKFFIFLTPFHYFVFTIILNDFEVLKYWKELTLFILVIILIGKKLSNLSQISLLTFNIFDIFLIYLLIPVFFSFLIMTDDKSDGLYMLRVYLQPILVYFIVKNLNLKEISLTKLTKLVFNVAVILSLYGLFQALLLGDQFLINLGYSLKYEGRLIDSYYISGFGNFQRLVSTFVNANVAALYLSFSLILVFVNSMVFTRLKLSIGIPIILIGIIFTFSRSTWIPLFFILIFMLFYLKDIYPSFKKIALFLPLFLLVIVFSLSGILKLGIFEKIYSFIYRSITFKDTSVAGRSDIWLEAINISKNNLFGIGLGNTGAKAMVLGNNTMISSESSYLTILLDFGVQGFIPFVLMFFVIGFINFKNIKKYKFSSKIKLLNVGSILGTFLIMTSMLFSNYIHDIEIFTIYYLLVGLSFNKFLYRNILQEEQCS